MSKVVILKLITGEEALASKTTDNLGMGGSIDYYEKVRVVVRGQDDRGQPTVGLISFIALAPDAKIQINKALIFAELPASASVEKSYLEATTGLVLAK